MFQGCAKLCTGSSGGSRVGGACRLRTRVAIACQARFLEDGTWMGKSEHDKVDMPLYVSSVPAVSQLTYPCRQLASTSPAGFQRLPDKTRAPLASRGAITDHRRQRSAVSTASSSSSSRRRSLYGRNF